MNTTLKKLIAAPLFLLAACGTPAESNGDCGDADSFVANGNTYCVATRAIIEKGFSCPLDMFGLEFGDVTVCSPSQQVPIPDQGPLYEYAQNEGGTGDPLQVCQGADPSFQSCASDSDCAAGEACEVSDAEVCRASSCSCDPTLGEWGCTADCLPMSECVAATAATCGDDPSEQECDSDADCAAGQTCADLDTAVCFPSSCTCDAGETEWSCTEDCQPERACVAGSGPTTCVIDADCLPDHLCAQGTCSPFEELGCTSDAECAEGDICDLDTTECVADPNACAADIDCPAGQTCTSGICGI